MVAGETRVARNGVWERRGRANIGAGTPDLFVSGIDGSGNLRAGTRPTEQNTGPDPAITLTPYTGPNAGGQVTVSTPNTVYQNIDFGNTRLRITTTGVQVINCKFRLTTYATNPCIDARSNTASGTYVYRCSFDNVAQDNRSMSGVMGWNITVERCSVKNMHDNLGFYVPSTHINNPIGVTVLDCWLGPMAFWWSPTVGVVHPSDTKSHNDGIQFQGGYGWRVINTTILATLSTTVGTGTPNSGSEYGWNVDYTQAQGEAARYEIVTGSGTYPNDYGGSLAAIMVNNTRGNRVECEIAYCWGKGGAFWLNAGEDFVSPFGDVHHNLIQNDQRHSGWAFGIKSGVTANVYENYWCDSNWVSTGVSIPRKNA